MGSAYQVHIVFLQEAGDDIWAESEGHAPVVFAPARDVFIWIGP